MNLDILISGGIFLVAVLTLVWGVTRWYATRERNTTDASVTAAEERLETAQRDLWSKIGALQVELAGAKQDLAVLKERIRTLPDREVLEEKLESLESKLEKKLDGLATSLQNSLKAMAEAMTTGVVAALKAHETRNN